MYPMWWLVMVKRDLKRVCHVLPFYVRNFGTSHSSPSWTLPHYPKKELHLLHLLVLPPWDHGRGRPVLCHCRVPSKSFKTYLPGSNKLHDASAVSYPPKIPKMRPTKGKQSMRFVGGSRFIFFCYTRTPKKEKSKKFWLESIPWTNHQTNHWQKLQQNLRASRVSFLRLKNMMQSPARFPFRWRQKAGDIVFNTMETIPNNTRQQRKTIFGIWYQKHIWCSNKSILLSDLQYRYIDLLATKVVKNSGFPTKTGRWKSKTNQANELDNLAQKSWYMKWKPDSQLSSTLWQKSFTKTICKVTIISHICQCCQVGPI